MEYPCNTDKKNLILLKEAYLKIQAGNFVIFFNLLNVIYMRNNGQKIRESYDKILRLFVRNPHFITYLFKYFKKKPGSYIVFGHSSDKKYIQQSLREFRENSCRTLQILYFLMG